MSEWGILSVFILLFFATVGLFVFFDRKFGHLFRPPKFTSEEIKKSRKQFNKESRKSRSESYTSTNNHDFNGGCDGGSC